MRSRILSLRCTERKVRRIRRRMRGRWRSAWRGGRGLRRSRGHGTRVRLSRWETVLCRGASLNPGAVGVCVIDGADTSRPRTLNRVRSVRVGRGKPVRRSIHSLLVEVIITRTLVAPASHPYIASNPNTTALFRNDTADVGARRQSRKLLGAVHLKLLRDNIQPEFQGRFGCRGLRQVRVGRWFRDRSSFSHILAVLGLLV